MDFVPYTGWIDVPDPNNPPPGARLVGADDLLRYEDALTQARDAINALPTQYTPLAHRGATTNVHGISDTANLVYTDDSRLSDARTPTSHNHPASEINSGTFVIARLPVAGSGVSSTTQVVRADDARLSDARPPTQHNHPQGEVTGLTEALSARMQVVQHAADAAVARPAGAAAVYWVGTVAPTNAEPHDLVLRTDTMTLSAAGAA